MKVIRDAIHKDIYLTDEEMEVIDTEEFQRLRNIKQTGLTYLVYPSANHTRFEHSLGCLYIANKMANKIKREVDVDIETVRLSALLHDIGHPPFSHTLEIFGYNHEEVGKKIIKKLDIGNKKEVIKTLSKKNLEGHIISGEVDADRMDYLLRDSYNTGTAYGMIDIHRIITSLKTFETFGKIKIGILKKGIEAIESLLIARHQMYSAVYFHKTVRIADTMLKRAVIKEIENKNLKLDELSKMDDIALISFLRENNNYLIERLDKRRLYKRVIYYDYYELSPKEKWILVNMKEEDILNLEKELQEKFGELFIDIYPIPNLEEHDIYIIMNNHAKKLDEVSPLARSLKFSEMKLWKLAVYSDCKGINKKEFKKELFKNLDMKIHSRILDVLNKHEIVEGRKNLLELSKLSKKEFYDELYKLIFSGLIKEKFYKNKYIYSINSKNPLPIK
ncbi:metal dependent phosphohydrolase [Methanocaldococcus villosus KIN24-T80]|uniref:Metal dependent phosphohydrolase n=1 Tax=Methanocaldococcus villosus KIN24-T80 TaxID=1069083 RepID=N6VQ07_9EURY|nr:HD domain-containing protein [Methanocaldococcus villosus]ENN95975.1 metal dependent phosphohydrolase [Methanocaldococcus villosus KIN24-T80]